MVAFTLPEVPTASMVPMIPFVTTSIMYQSGFMRGPSVHTVSVTGVAHTHIAFGRLAVVTFVVALRHKVAVALTVHLISVTRSCSRDNRARRVVQWADGVVIVAWVQIVLVDTTVAHTRRAGRAFCAVKCVSLKCLFWRVCKYWTLQILNNGTSVAYTVARVKKTYVIHIKKEHTWFIIGVVCPGDVH